MVEDLLTLNFHIMGVITPQIDIPFPSSDITYKKDETLKMCLLSENNYKELSTKNISKLQLANNLKNNLIVLYDFSKGLSNKEIEYFKNLFKMLINKYQKQIILVSRDVNFLIKICDTITIYSNKIIYHTTSWLDDKLYEYIDMPKSVEIIKCAQAKGINLSFTYDVNELIKDIYRRKNEN